MEETPLNVADIKNEIKLLKKLMKYKNIRIVSCFNAGLSADEKLYNTKLFALKTKLIELDNGWIHTPR